MKNNPIRLIVLISLHSFVRSQETLTYHVLEEKPAMSFVGNIAQNVGIDKTTNTELLNTIRYSYLSVDSSVTDMFVLNSTTSDLFTSKPIDREKMCGFSLTCFVTMDVVAKSSEDVFFRIISLKIHIEDINDNSPEFTSNIMTLDIPENVQIKATFGIEGATDRDANEKNTVSKYYIISGSSPFELKEMENLDGSSTLSLQVTSNLDREQTPSYRLMIFAEDNGVPRRSGSATINVNVVDVNDNAPVFDMSDYNVTIGEDIPPQTVILTLNATDGDAGRNAEIRYRLNVRQAEKIRNTFSVDAVSGELSVISALEPSVERYRVVVEVADRSDQPLFSQAIVDVYVLDTRNSAPVIKLNLLTGEDYAEVSESARIGTVVAYFRVVDSDTGSNGLVSCSLESDIFELQEFRSEQYKVKLVDALDREVTPAYTISVICTDTGASPLSALATFSINVRDVNDNAPQFSKDTYEVTLMENNNIGDFIVTVVATDMDEDTLKQMKYFLNSSDTDYLSIDSNSGVITANSVFDREIQSVYIFSVYADDSGSPPLTSTATLMLQIDDSNDCSPEFAQSNFNFHVSENLPKGIIAGILSATDSDTPKYGNITFQLGPDADNLPFTVAIDGRIISKNVLDREIQSRYDFTVIAKDGGVPYLYNTAHVTVFVQDENDNLPVILYPNNYNNTIYLNSEVSQHAAIARVIAFDADEGFNGELRYSLKSGNDTEFLVIDSKTGEIFPTADLKLLKYPAVQSYTVIVSDRGDESLFSTAYLRLEIGPVSAHPPAESNDMKLTLIAIAIGVVTVLVAIIVVATLIVIRQMDRKNSTSRATCYTEKPNNLQTDTIKEPILKEKPEMARTGVYQVQIPNDSVNDSTAVPMCREFSKGGDKLRDATHTSDGVQQHTFYRQSSPVDMITQLRREVSDKLKNEEVRFGQHPDEFDINSTSDSGRGGSEEDVRFLHTDTSLMSNETEGSRGQRSSLNSNRLSHKNPRKVTFDDSTRKQTSDNLPLNSLYLHNNAKFVEQERNLCRTSPAPSEHYPHLSSQSQNADELSRSVPRDFHMDSNDGSDNGSHNFTFVNNRLQDTRRQPFSSLQDPAVFVQDFSDIQV